MISMESSPQEIVSWVNTEFDQAKTARTTFERQWYTNIAFYLGKQWVTWAQSGSFANAKLVEPSAPPWRVRLTINLLRSYVRRELARLSNNAPRGYVMPATSDGADQAAARAAESLHSYLIEATELDVQEEIADLWCILTGNGYLKTYYSEEIDPASGMMGKICVEPISPFHLFVPALDEPRLNKQPWVMHAAVKSTDWVYSTYGVEMKPEDKAGTDLLEERLFNAMGLTDKNATKKGILVKEVWIAPCASFPEGALCAVAQGKLLGDSISPWPYAHGHFPFISRIHTPTNRFYGSCFIDDLIPLQKEYNKQRSKIVESVNLMTKPQWVVEKGTVDVRQMTSEPGAIIQVIPGASRPQQTQLSPLPSYVMDNIQRVREEMNEIASQNEVTKGTVPGRVEAATAIAYLQERDDSALVPAIRSKERSYQEVGRQLLSLVVQYWDAQRTIQVVGKNENFEAFLLSGADLRGNTDFRVVPGSAIPVSRAAKKAELMELMKMGVIPAHKGLAYLDMPELGRLYEELQADARQAQRENLKLMQGVFAPVEVWHDHMAHLAEHTDQMKREEWENSDEQVKYLFRLHNYIHLKFLVMSFGLQPQVQEMTDPMNPGAIDPNYETELWRLATLLQVSGGTPPQGGPQQ